MMTRLASTVVKSAAAAVDVVRRPATGLVVLVYHRVGARTPMSVDLPRAQFENQLAWLAENAEVVTLDDGLRWVEQGSVTDRGTRVAITFDDGTVDFVEEALPGLERYRIPATLYLATDFVEHGRPFPHDGVPISWSALRDAVDSGWVTVGSHTNTHALLDRLEEPKVAGELDVSVELIGERLGVQARHFAYPKAVAGSPYADRLVRERFASAALAGGRSNRPGATDAHALARTPVQRADADGWFRRKARGGMAFEDTLRRVANRARYSDATT